MTALIDRLLNIMASLRHPETGCPWDVEQTFQTIAPYTIEEAYEVADAIEQDDMNHLCDELGDLLLQVVFHARIAEEAGHFDFADVVDGVSEKMVRRHPHVFADANIKDAKAQTVHWEDIKQQERASKNNGDNGAVTSAMDGVVHALPALLRAQKLQNRAARVGFDWGELAPVCAKIREELSEVEAEIDQEQPLQPSDAVIEEMGDLLFSVVNLCRHLDIDAETALRHGNHKFEQRFRAMEDLSAKAGEDFAKLSLQDQECFWQQAKQNLSENSPERQDKE